MTVRMVWFMKRRKLMQEIEFNLLTEPWVRVRLPDNTVQEVSLTKALVHAQE